MMNDFIDFVHQMFPQISPCVRDKVKESIKQFDLSGKKLNHFLYEPLEVLSQGDVIDQLNFIWFDNNGKMSVLKTKGMLLSNTCDAQRDKFLLFAPFVQLTEADEKLKSSIVKNQVSNLLYFPDKNEFDYAIDFSMTQTPGKPQALCFGLNIPILFLYRIRLVEK
ncbi:MAG: hypothetical protein M0Z31_06000 [Clostridia bacterium]|nr:hypothetical protein [Clostridia bacterium]